MIATARHRLRIDLLFILSLMVSISLHFLGAVSSRYIEIGQGSGFKEEIAKLFRVELADLGAIPVRPTELTQDAEGDAEARIDEELQQLEALPAPRVDNLIDQLLQEQTALVEFTEEDRLKLQGVGLADGAGLSPITAEESRRAVSSAGDSAGGGLLESGGGVKPIAVGSSDEALRQRILTGLESAQSPGTEITQPPRGLTLPPVTLNGPTGAGLGVETPSLAQPPSFSDIPSVDMRGGGGIGRPIVTAGFLDTESQDLEQRRQSVVNLDDVLGAQMFVYRPSGEPGYFHLRIRPQRADHRLEPLPKDVVLVLDASQSIGSRTLEHLKEGIKQALRRLRPDDRFTIVGFRSRVMKFSEDLVPASPLTIAEAWKFIDPLEPSGRTDIYSALQDLMLLGTERARPFILVLFSDGRPNVGMTDSRNIINRLSANRAPSTTIFSFGAGRAVNRYLLDLLAYRNRGRSVYSEDWSDIEFNVGKIMSTLENPVLMRMQMHMPGIDIQEIYPKELPDLYRNSMMDIYGRLGDQKEIVFRMAGEALDDSKEMVIRIPVPERDNASDEVARSWAYQKMLWLIGQTVQLGETPALMTEINRISRDYRVQSGYEGQFGAG